MHDPPEDSSPGRAPLGTRPGNFPRVVVVGRPNVGKSTLFNALAGRRVSIEDPMAGVTRDRVSFLLDQEHATLELVDTGGIGLVDEALLRAEVEHQIATALELADLVLFVIDAKLGVTAIDRQIADRLRRLGRPVVLVANKVESPKDELGAGEAHALGFGVPVRVSARERLGITDLRDDLFARLGEQGRAPMMPSDVVHLAIVGRMNSGKSTLVNALVGEQRVIVSEVEGTTRDAVDVPFVFRGRRFVAIDTAGIRKRKTISDSVEFYGQSRAERAIRRANVVLLLLDATRDVGRIDRQIADQVMEAGVPALLVVTKWDLARAVSDTTTYEAYLRSTLPGLDFAPISFIAAPDGLNLEPTLLLAAELHDQAGQRVSTGELNRLLQRAYEIRKPKPVRGRIGKVFFASQVQTHPPTIVVAVNDPALFEESWRRFLVHQLQAGLPYSEIPVRILFHGRGMPRP